MCFWFAPFVGWRGYFSVIPDRAILPGFGLVASSVVWLFYPVM